MYALSLYKYVCPLYVRVWFSSSHKHQFSPIRCYTTLAENSCCILESAQGTGCAFNIFAVPTVYLSEYSFIWNDIMILHRYLLSTSYESSNVVGIESMGNKIPSLLKLAFQKQSVCRYSCFTLIKTKWCPPFKLATRAHLETCLLK